MTKKLLSLTLTIILFSFQFSNSQNSNSNFNTKEFKDKVDAIISTKNSRLSVSTGSKVLNYVQDGFGIDLNTTLANLGFTVTDEFGNENLQTVLPSDTWDLVIIQAHNVDLTVAEVAAIEDYINNGGKLIISYWNLNNDSTLQGILGISNTISFSSPLTVTSWETTHAIFNTPNTVNSLAVIGDNGGADNGDKLEPDADSTALAGFTATTITNEAAIILSNNNSVLVHGFGGADMDLTAFTDLIENEAEFLVTPKKVLNYLQDGFGLDLNATLANIGFTVTDEFGNENLQTVLPSDT